MAKIEVSSKLDPSGFQSGLDQMKNAANAFGGKMGTIGAGVAGAFAGGGLVGIITQTIRELANLAAAGVNYGDQLHDMSIESGVSTEAMQRWSRTATLNGGSAEKMSMAFFRLRDAQSQVVDGDKKMTKAFSELGISAGEVASTDLDSLMLRVASALTEGNNAGSAFHATADILGKRTLPTLVGTLNAAAQGVEEFGKRSTDMTDAQIVRLDMLKDKWTSMKNTVLSVLGIVSAAILGVTSKEVQSRVDAEKRMRDAAKETNEQSLRKSDEEKADKFVKSKTELDQERSKKELDLAKERKKLSESEHVSGFSTAGVDSATKMGGMAGIGGLTNSIYSMEASKRTNQLLEKMVALDEKQKEIETEYNKKLATVIEKLETIVEQTE